MHEDEPTTGQVTSDGDQQQTVKADETGGGLLAPGERVDRYVVRERLGEGGFAEVYLAEQEEPLRRRVALKIIKLGMDTKQVIARFEAERQALAMMDHPNVAKVFDAGSTESGRSYIVGLTVSMWMYRVAESARREAVLARDEAEAARRDEAEQRRLSEKAREEERQAEITRSINEYLEQILAAPVPWAAHTGGVVARDVKIVDVLDAASVKIDETLTEHPEVEAAVRATLGQAYFDLGYTERGATHLTRAFEIRRRVLGEEHPDTLKSMRQVGWVYSNENSIDAAVSMFSKAWELSLRVLGEEHPETLDSMSELAIQRHIQGRYDEAQSLFEKVLEVRHRTLGDEHPRTLLAMSNLLELYENQGRLEEAETLGAKALEIMQRVPGTEPMLASSVMSTLAHVYAAEERWEEAEVLATEALETHRRIQGEEHPDTLMFMSDAGRLYIDRGLFDKAEPLVAGAVAGANESLPKGHRWTGVCLLHLGRCLTGLKRYREAEDALQEGYRILELAVGPENVRVTRAVSALGDLYDAWDKPEKAAEWRAKLATAQEAVASDQPGQRSSDEK